jgi:uncharacterized coiled-coil DUF342 family protein
MTAPVPPSDTNFHIPQAVKPDELKKKIDALSSTNLELSAGIQVLSERIRFERESLATASQIIENLTQEVGEAREHCKTHNEAMQTLTREASERIVGLMRQNQLLQINLQQALSERDKARIELGRYTQVRRSN